MSQNFNTYLKNVYGNEQIGTNLKLTTTIVTTHNNHKYIFIQ